MVQHLDLGRLKALHVRMATAIHVEAEPIPHATAKRKQKDLIADIVSAADKLWDQPIQRLDHSVWDLAGNLEAPLVKSDDQEVADLCRRYDALVGALNCISCESCAGANVCRDEPAHDNMMISQYGRRLEPLKEILTLLQRWCEEIYAELSDHTPRLELSTAHTHDLADQGLLDRFGTSGWHQASRGTGLVSTIGLTIRDRAFNWQSLCSIYYTFLHEIFCHAFQALDAASREDADRYCPWTEGWMDRLAFELAQEWLIARAHELPSWIRNHAAEIARITSSIHDYRFQSSALLPDPHGDRRRSASQAFESLWRAWARTGQVSQHQITLFSIRLNLIDLSPADRMNLGINLPLVLAEPESQRYELAVGLCADFAMGEIAGSDFQVEIRKLLYQR